MVTDDALATADSFATAQVLKGIVEDKVSDYDLILTGDGSADFYAGQVNVQLAAALGVPTINEVTSIAAEGDKVVVERTLEEEVEEIEVPLPAVIAVSPSIGEPRIPGMREILAAGKKPSTVDELAGGVDAKIEIEEIKAPELAPVSYTHLDVYKRQGKAPNQKHHCIDEVSIPDMMHLGAKRGHRVTIITNLGAIFGVPNLQRLFLRLLFFLLLFVLLIEKCHVQPF